MPQDQEFDAIVAGAGAAGLGLVYALAQAGLNKRILLIERDAKTRNDRTWCFWHTSPAPFGEIAHRTWDSVWFHGPKGSNFSKKLGLAPFRYHMVRGLDFYNFMHDWIAARPNITRIAGNIEELRGHANHAEALVDGKTHRAPWVFNSALQPTLPTGHQHMLQHFKGWVVETQNEVFDPHSATFMDFRVPQAHDTRFVYVLPLDTRRALVEYTIFGTALLPHQDYDTALRAYLHEQLALQDFGILETEFGVIPMTDAPHPRLHAPRVMNIGLASGRAKASTGYAFLRIQEQAQHIARSWRDHGTPLYDTPNKTRHAWMDSVYLRVLLSGQESGAAFYTRLFERNDHVQVLRFLNENTNLLEDLRLMTSVNIPVFLRAGLAHSFGQIQKGLA